MEGIGRHTTDKRTGSGRVTEGKMQEMTRMDKEGRKAGHATSVGEWAILKETVEVQGEMEGTESSLQIVCVCPVCFLRKMTNKERENS